VPKRCSQTACGVLHSACNHGAATLACKGTRFAPLSISVEIEEGTNEELAAEVR
jgi:hypothetical protein